MVSPEDAPPPAASNGSNAGNGNGSNAGNGNGSNAGNGNGSSAGNGMSAGWAAVAARANGANAVPGNGAAAANGNGYNAIQPASTYMGYSKLRTRTALGCYSRPVSRSMGPP